MSDVLSTTELVAQNAVGLQADLVEKLAERLRARQQWLVTAESCTGGLIAGACTDLAAVTADGFVSAAARVATASMLGSAAAVSTAAPPPIEWPSTAARVALALGWVACTQAIAASKSLAKDEWLGNRPPWLFGAMTR